MEPRGGNGCLCKADTGQDETEKYGLIDAKSAARFAGPEPPASQRLEEGGATTRGAQCGRLSASPCRGSCAGAPPPEQTAIHHSRRGSSGDVNSVTSSLSPLPSKLRGAEAVAAARGTERAANCLATPLARLTPPTQVFPFPQTASPAANKDSWLL